MEVSSPQNRSAASPRDASMASSPGRSAMKQDSAASPFSPSATDPAKSPSAEDGTAASNVAIDPTKDLWQNITRNVKDANAEPSETNLLIVGSPGSGKTSLLHRIYSSFQSSSASSGGGAKKVKPTTALDYSFARRAERNAAQVAHFWEIAQGTQFAQLLDIVVTPENIHAMVVAVVVDATEDGLMIAWETATYWLKRVDQRISEIAERMKVKGSSTPAKLVARAQKVIGGTHPDLKKMRLSGVPTVLVVNKIDAFRGDTQQLKLLCRSMRFLAHLYGAHVVFTSESESVRWRALMNHILFQAPFDAKYLQTDPERSAVLLTVDRDSFIDIGDPPVSQGGYGGSGGGMQSSSTGDADLDRWKAPFDAAFPSKPIAEEDKVTDDPFIRRLYDVSEGGFGEPALDALRKQKDAELEQYRKSGAGGKGSGK